MKKEHVDSGGSEEQVYTWRDNVLDMLSVPLQWALDVIDFFLPDPREGGHVCEVCYKRLGPGKRCSCS